MRTKEELPSIEDFTKAIKQSFSNAFYSVDNYPLPIFEEEAKGYNIPEGIYHEIQCCINLGYKVEFEYEWLGHLFGIFKALGFQQILSVRLDKFGGKFFYVLCVIPARTKSIPFEGNEHVNSIYNINEFNRYILSHYDAKVYSDRELGKKYFVTKYQDPVIPLFPLFVKCGGD